MVWGIGGGEEPGEEGVLVADGVAVAEGRAGGVTASKEDGVRGRGGVGSEVGAEAAVRPGKLLTELLASGIRGGRWGEVRVGGGAPGGAGAEVPLASGLQQEVDGEDEAVGIGLQGESASLI